MRRFGGHGPIVMDSRARFSRSSCLPKGGKLSARVGIAYVRCSSWGRVGDGCPGQRPPMSLEATRSFVAISLRFRYTTAPPGARWRSPDFCNAFAPERALKGMVNSLILRQNAAG